MTDNKEYEGFTIGLALVDCLPVIICGITLAILAIRFDSLLFKIGAFLIVIAGLVKCIWKFIVAISKKDIKILFYQMRVVMPVGFMLVIISLFIDRSKLSFASILTQMTAFPNFIFYLLGVVAMCLMGYFGKHLDSSDANSNWVEQLTNAIGQLCFLLGVIL